MRVARTSLFTLIACLFSGCSAQILEDVGDVSIPRECAEPAKLFKNFSVRAKRISWSGSPQSQRKLSTLTVELIFENATNWPVALSNSGNGILYSVEYLLHGEHGFSHAPKETGGVTNETRPKENSGEEKKPGEKQKPIIDAHQPIKPDAPAEGKLVFDVPRGNYILAIERKFAGKLVPVNREDHLTVCKISPKDFSAPSPANLRGVSGVY